MSKVPLHVLPGFVAAARLLNLSRAAASLHVTVSALSHQMRGLEELLGQRLFDRGPRGLRLTAARRASLRAGGAAPRRHLRRARAPAGAEPAHADRERDAARWPRAGSSPGCRRFTALHPEVELSLQSTRTWWTSTGRRWTPRCASGRAAGRACGRTSSSRSGWCRCAAPSCSAASPRSERGDFSGVPLLRDLGERWHAWFARFGGSPPARYVAAFDDTDALQRAAVEGMGVGAGPTDDGPAAARERAAGRAHPSPAPGRLRAPSRLPPEVREPSGAGRVPDLGARRRPCRGGADARPAGPEASARGEADTLLTRRASARRAWPRPAATMPARRSTSTSSSGQRRLQASAGRRSRGAAAPAARHGGTAASAPSGPGPRG